MAIQPYETTGGKVEANSELPGLLARSLTLADPSEPGNQFRYINRGKGKSPLVKIVPGGAQIPPFSQALKVEQSDGVQYYCVDVRPYVRITNAVNGTYNINHHVNYNITVEKAALQIIADEMGITRLLSLGEFPAWAFSQWITQAIHRRLTLDLDAQNIVLILTVYYWYCLHSNTIDKEFDRIEITRIIGQIYKVTGIDYNVINQVLNEAPVLRDVNGLLSMIKERTGNSRVASLDTAGMFLMVGQSMSAPEPRLTAAIALESPIVFNVVLYNTLNNHGAMRSVLGGVIKPREKSSLARNYLMSYANMIKVFNSTVINEPFKK